jgi:hypothetical protein
LESKKNQPKSKEFNRKSTKFSKVKTGKETFRWINSKKATLINTLPL